MKILLAEMIHPKGVALLEEHHQVIVASGVDGPTLCKEIQGMDALIVRSIDVPNEVMECADKLKVIGRHGMGIDNIDLNVATGKGIMVVNTPTANMQSVAEHIVTVILSSAKRVVTYHNAVKAGVFSRGDVSLPRLAQELNYLGREVKEQKVGLIGLGKIGSKVAHICSVGLGMRVFAYDPYLPADFPFGQVERKNTLKELLEESDYVSLQVPLTPQTKDIIGYEEICMMKESAYLINVSRGPVVNEEGLLMALREKRIEGAVLDVYWQEPPPADHPLLKMDNVLLTPHVAGVTEESLRQISLQVAEGVLDALAGKEPCTLCNPDCLDALGFQEVEEDCQEEAGA